MPSKSEKTELGSVRIDNEVIGAIASVAACEVSGVAKVGGSLAKNLCDYVRKRHFYKGVKIDAVNENELKITIFIMVHYGHHIPSVATQVQESVRSNVEKMTGLSLSEVDVVIQGVVPPGPKRPIKSCENGPNSEVKNENT